jgi:hypothetical protein
MKKITLIALLCVTVMHTSATIRVKNFDPIMSKLVIQNFVSFAYNYELFQISIGNNYYTLNTLNYTGNLYMAAYAYVYFTNINMPPFTANGPDALSGTSIAIWYPNSLPNNATPSNLVDFLQYGSAGNPYESVAVAAGKWTAGDFISVSPPYQFNGTINDYGSTFFSTATDVPSIASPENSLHIAPNPATTTLTLYVPKNFNSSRQPVELTIYNANGSAVLTTVKEATEEYLVDCSGLSEGIYTVRLKDGNGDCLTRSLVKKKD